MADSKKTTVCFTGHRPKGIFPNGPYDEHRRQDYQAIVNKIADFVRKMVSLEYTRFCSGGAQGFDQLCFWAVNQVKREHPGIQNIVYIPFEGQERRWAKQGLFSQSEYQLMLKHADEVHICVKDINITDNRSVVKALMYRNKCMVDNSDYVFGQFADDSWKNPNTKSGTADCLRYAQKLNKPIQILNTNFPADCRPSHNPLPMCS